MNIPTTWDLYRHYKSTWGTDYTYEIIGIAKHSETQELMVIYLPLYPQALDRQGEAAYTVRPLDMRNETVTRDGKQMLRFTKMEKQ